MKYFGILNKKKLINLKIENLSDFLIENNLFKKSEKKMCVLNDDEIVMVNGKEVDKLYTTLKRNDFNIYFIYFFLKLITIQLQKQLKKDLIGITKKETKLSIFFSDELGDFELEPSEGLLEDIYDSLVTNYWEYISDLKYIFYNKFYEEIFGLNFKKQKIIALKHYKNISNNLQKTHFIDYQETVFKNNKIEFKFQNKLKAIYLEKEKYLKKILLINPFFHYLIGDNIIFKHSFYKKNQVVLDEIIKYEANKEIMIKLNQVYNFEEDYYFTYTLEEKKKFLEYDKVFDSIKSYKFTNTMIRDLENDLKANIESLYEFLRVNNLVKKGKSNFISFLQKEHDIELTKIISYINYDNRKDFPLGGKKSNLEHDKRVKKFEEKWKKYI